MSKEEYLKQLQKYLKKLPKQDYEDAMEYFIEYFEETDEAGAQELIAPKSEFIIPIALAINVGIAATIPLQSDSIIFGASEPIRSRTDEKKSPIL